MRQPSYLRSNFQRGVKRPRWPGPRDGRRRAGGEHNGSVRCPILVGRQEPAALIAAAVRARRPGRGGGRGRGSALVIAGEAGIGKSRLAEHMSASAARAGIRVAAGRAVRPASAARSGRSPR